MTRGGDELYAELRGFFADEKLYRITGALAHNRDAVIAILNKALAEHKRAALVEAAELARQIGKPHTMASENADIYQAFQNGCNRVADKLEHLAQQGDTNANRT